ncbi:unnamed protein product [Adineta ricciae]|uniref:G-protein coupled receptors family 1 profile domain-containing protein n=1 Tax=Adineta ricciae TaxID=249248 RepID=A0A813NVD6_ADIRI|nr:unnamed protein product [Adineta ricciae]CAF0744284.1 unnamed protein product [Adineta ricciae]
MDLQENITSPSIVPKVERYFKFYFLLILHIPSLVFTFLILFNFKWKRLVTQIFGILLIVNALLILAELPFTLQFLYKGYLLNAHLCPVWVLINYSLFILSMILITWTSIERYLFIYHELFIKHHSILFHYLPVVLFSLYTPIFYISLVIFYPCEQAYTVYSYICNGPCYLFNSVPCLIDWGINVVLVLGITCFVNIVIIIRNIIQRGRMKRLIITAGNRQQWHRTLRLSFQLFSISSLCIIGWIPYGIVSSMQIFNNTPTLAYLLSTFFIYFPYIQTLLLPYVCIFFMPEIKQKLGLKWKNLYLFKKVYPHNRVHIAQTDQNYTLQDLTHYF